MDYAPRILSKRRNGRTWLVAARPRIYFRNNKQSLNTILSGKRGISPDMARALGDAFDVPAEFFLNLQQAFDLSRAEQPDPGVAIRTKMQNYYPVREMIKRGWIEQSDPTMLELQLTRFFHANNTDEIPYMAHAAKKSRYEELEIPPAQLAWLSRVRQIAESISVPQYSKRNLHKAIGNLETLLLAPDETLKIRDLVIPSAITDGWGKWHR
jgi:HTH-type transcriptional regulator / antitoxin HigA